VANQAKIDPKLLLRWTDQGKSQTWIATQFGVTPQAISKHVKRLKAAKAKYAVEDGLRPAVEHKVNAIEQLTKINKSANDLLDLLQRFNDGDQEAIRILNSQTKMVNVGTRTEPEMMEVANFKDPRELQIRVIAEIRMQMNTALDIQKTMFHIEEVKGILDSIIQIVKERVPPDVQKLIADEVMKRRALRLEVS